MNDSDRPDWRPDYWKTYLEPLWQRVSDVYHGLHTYELKTVYLRQQLGEHNDIYDARVRTVAFENRLSPSVKSHAGLLSEYRVNADTPETIVRILDDVDGLGNSLESVLLDWDIDGLLFNATLALVDVPPRDQNGARVEPRPRIVPISVRDVFAPMVGMVDGSKVVTRLCIRRSALQQEGLFGTRMTRHFWVYRLMPLETPLRRSDGSLQTMQATFEKWEELESKTAGVIGSDSYQMIEPPQPIRNAAGRPLDRIPIVWYSPYGDPLLFTGVDNMIDRGGTPEYMSLVDLNIEYFNKHSELNTAESRGNFVLMKLRFPGERPPTIPDLITGNRMAVLEGGAELELLEPEGTALASTREGQDRRIQRMDAIAQSFLTGGDIAMTATQAIIESSQSRLGLRNIARRKESAVQQLFAWIETFSNPAYRNGDPVGGITVSEAVLSVPPTPQELQFWQSEYLNGSLTRAQYHAKQRELGVFNEEMAELENSEGVMSVGLVATVPATPAVVEPEEEDNDDDDDIPE